MEEEVILVDAFDNEIGVMEKLEAHRGAFLHRAFSVFIFDSQNRLLLQQRAHEKYHSGDLFTNTCCSHPRPGEDTLAAAKRRLAEEMGISAELTFRTTFLYRSEFENGLTEHELDHIFEGRSDEQPTPDPHEVQSFCWLSVPEVKSLIKESPERFTTWFRIAIEKFY